MSSPCGLSMAQEEEIEEEEDDDERSLKAKFTAAVRVIRSLPEEGDEAIIKTCN